jgi:hypothetical protein
VQTGRFGRERQLGHTLEIGTDARAAVELGRAADYGSLVGSERVQGTSPGTCQYHPGRQEGEGQVCKGPCPVVAFVPLFYCPYSDSSSNSTSSLCPSLSLALFSTSPTRSLLAFDHPADRSTCLQIVPSPCTRVTTHISPSPQSAPPPPVLYYRENDHLVLQSLLPPPLPFPFFTSFFFQKLATRKKESQLLRISSDHCEHGCRVADPRLWHCLQLLQVVVVADNNTPVVYIRADKVNVDWGIGTR